MTGQVTDPCVETRTHQNSDKPVYRLWCDEGCFFGIRIGQGNCSWAKLCLRCRAERKELAHA